MLHGTGQAKFKGGPCHGNTYDVQLPPPEFAYFGSHGGFVYRLDRRIPGRVIRYRYDRVATRQRLTDLGIPLHLVEEAVQDDTPQPVERTPEPGTTRQVAVSLVDGRWRMVCDGKVVATRPRTDITTAEDAKQWVEQTVPHLQEAS